MGAKARVLLVEDHASFRQALAMAIEHSGASVVAQAGNVAEAEEVLATMHDVAVVDLGLPDGSGSEVVRGLRSTHPASRVLVLTASFAPEDAAFAVEAGASGVMSKSASLEEILASVECLLGGGDIHSAEEMMEMLRIASQTREREREARSRLEKLTPREMEVLDALSEGLDRREIASRLHISLNTEHTHVANILSKLGVHSRLEAVVFMVRLGINDR